MIEIAKLSNGIPVLMDYVDDLKSFTLGAFVKTGARHESEEEYGVSHYIEHMLFKGTKTRSAKEISEIIDDCGGSMNAYTSRDTTCYYVKMLSDKLELTLDIFADMFLNSTFTEENLEKERNVILEEIKMYEDIPEDTVHDLNLRFALNNEYGNVVLGTEKSLKSITREKFLNYFNSRYVPENIGIAIAGNFDKELLIDFLEKSFGTMNKEKKDSIEIGTFSHNKGENVVKRDCNQVHLCFNTMGLSVNDDDRYAMAILSNTLGENMSSRLFQKIREERGLAYSIYSYTTNFTEGGLYTIYAGTSKESYKEVINLIKEELNLVKVEGIDAKELQRAQNQIKSMLVFALENSRGKMIRMWNSYQLYGKVLTVEEIEEQISKVTLEDIKKLANRIFNEKDFSLTVLGEV
ncbi:MAG: insulinase family protein [Fusobacteriaceae bacterium]|nr:insulinase family protein [Fusobacteriaceae bacterium]